MNTGPAEHSLQIELDLSQECTLLRRGHLGDGPERLANLDMILASASTKGSS